MEDTRRQFVAAAGALIATGVTGTAIPHSGGEMYGLIGKITAPAVPGAIAKGRPMIAGISNRVETAPLGGQGIPAAAKRADV